METWYRWTDSRTLQCIYLSIQHECLWKVDRQDYSNHLQQQKAWNVKHSIAHPTWLIVSATFPCSSYSYNCCKWRQNYIIVCHCIEMTSLVTGSSRNYSYKLSLDTVYKVQRAGNSQLSTKWRQSRKSTTLSTFDVVNCEDFWLCHQCVPALESIQLLTVERHVVGMVTADTDADNDHTWEVSVGHMVKAAFGTMYIWQVYNIQK